MTDNKYSYTYRFKIQTVRKLEELIRQLEVVNDDIFHFGSDPNPVLSQIASLSDGLTSDQVKHFIKKLFQRKFDLMGEIILTKFGLQTTDGYRCRIVFPYIEKIFCDVESLSDDEKKTLEYKDNCFKITGLQAYQIMLSQTSILDSHTTNNTMFFMWLQKNRRMLNAILPSNKQSLNLLISGFESNINLLPLRVMADVQQQEIINLKNQLAANQIQSSRAGVIGSIPNQFMTGLLTGQHQSNEIDFR
jgi:hypothetical protein